MSTCKDQGCDCQINIDIERDKKGLRNIFRMYDENVEVSYSEYMPTKDEGKEVYSRGLRKQYHVTVDHNCVLDSTIQSAEWHGIHLSSIHSNLGYQMRTKLSFIFER